MSYQQWFYPVKDAVYTSNYRHECRGSSAQCKIQHRYSQMKGINHFQPQISADHQCVAQIIPGHKYFSRRWVKVDCSKHFSNVTVICESPAGENLSHISEIVDGAAYNEVSYVTAIAGKLSAPPAYCRNRWFHIRHSCFMGFTKDQDKFVHLKESEFSLLKDVYHWKHRTHLILNGRVSVCEDVTISSSLSEHKGLYQCADDTFIVEHHVCDGDPDCPDASDEQDCNNICTFFGAVSNMSCYTMCTSDTCVCNLLYYQCTKGGCIPLSKFCDSVPDCEDKSDEILCTNKEKVAQGEHEESRTLFECMNGKSIDTALVNDTVPDCPVYGDDEIWPSDSRQNVRFSKDSIMLACIPGHPKMFHHHLLCQLAWNAAGHLATCRNGAHLSDCIYHSCPHQYKCAYSYCISVHAVCDGRVDCPNGSDETDCPILSCPHFLKCKIDGICIHKTDVNNGINDCKKSHDDEITKDIALCPVICQCVGHAVYCRGQPQDIIPQVIYARSLIIRAERPLIITKHTFHSVKKLNYLDLSHCDFTYVTPSIFRNLQTLIKLLLVNVSISVIPSYLFEGLVTVKELHLSDNEVKSIQSNAFSGMSSLPDLDLSNQMLSSIAPCSFHSLKSLWKLNITNNLISAINKNMMCGLHNLKIFDLRGNDINFVDTSAFVLVTNLQVLESNIPGMCCYVDIQHCSPKFKDDISSCSNILAGQVLKYSVWVIAVLSIAENIFAFGFVAMLKKVNSKQKMVHNLHVMHLILSDLIMGFYFLALSIFNEVYEGNFVTVAHIWKKGLHCKLLSALSMLSFQMSLYMALLLSLERFVALSLPLKGLFSSLKSARLILFVGWVINAAIAVLPVVIFHFNQRGLNNAVCVTMLAFEILNTWYLFTVLILNTFTAVINIIMNSCVIYALWNQRKHLEAMTVHQQRKRSDAAITVRIICVVLASSTCWMVMVLVGILLKSGVIIKSHVFSMCAVIVLPISILLNPLLNIYTTSEFTIFWEKILRR